MLLCHTFLRRLPNYGILKALYHPTKTVSVNLSLQLKVVQSKILHTDRLQCRNCNLLKLDQLVWRQQSMCLSQGNDDKERLGRLLYVGQDKKKIKGFLGVFYSLSGIVAIATPYLLQLSSNSIAATIFMAFHIFVFVVLNPLGFYQFGKRYVNELYFNKESNTYTAVMLSPTVINEKRLEFTAKDCTMPANPSVFTSFYVKKHPLFVNSDSMLYEDYMEMLRYASDFDYENPERHEQYSDQIKDAVAEKRKSQEE